MEVLRQYDAEAAPINRDKLLADLVKKLVDEPADYKKSIFKHNAEKVKVFSTVKISRQDLINEQARHKEWLSNFREKQETERIADEESKIKDTVGEKLKKRTTAKGALQLPVPGKGKMGASKRNLDTKNKDDPDRKKQRSGSGARTK